MKILILAGMLFLPCIPQAQTIDIEDVVEVLFCDSSRTSILPTIYTIEDSSDKMFDFYEMDSTCVDLVVFAQKEELLRVLRKEKEILLFRPGRIVTDAGDANMFQCVFSLVKVYWKLNKKEIKRVVDDGEYQFTFRKNAETEIWDIEYNRGELRRR